MILKIDEKRDHPGVVVLEMAGRICMGRDCQEVEWRLNDLLKKEETKVIFDMSQVQLVDSTGIGILVTCYGRLRKAGGELRLAGVQGKVREVLTMTNVDKIIHVFPDAAAAAQGF
jgi:anti-sigma B factor antagonist